MIKHKTLLELISDVGDKFAQVECGAAQKSADLECIILHDSALKTA